MTKTERAYCAGIVDGEGTISMHIGKQVSKYTGNTVISMVRLVRVTNTNLGLLEWLQKTTGYGNISKLWQNPHSQYDRFRKGNVKPMYAWTVSGKNMVDFLTQIKSYLIIKPELADLLLESLGLARKRGDGAAYSQGILARQKEIRERVKQINQRGIIHASI